MHLITKTDLNDVYGGQITLEATINLSMITAASIVATIVVGTAGGFVGSTISYAASDDRYTVGGMIIGGALGCLIPIALLYTLL